MNKPDPGARRVLFTLGLAVLAALLLWLALALALLHAASPGAGVVSGGVSGVLAAVLSAGWPAWALVLVGAWLVAALASAALLPLWRRHVAAAACLHEQAQALLQADGRAVAPAGASRPLQGLADTLSSLVLQRRASREDVARQAQQAQHQLSDERARLAALLAELNQSVVVCNRDGRILLYNHRARLQFKALSQAPAAAGGAELIGLGRSIYAALDREQLSQALQSIELRLERGAAHPAAEFVVCTRLGQRLRVHMAPVRQLAPVSAPGPAPGTAPGPAPAPVHDAEPRAAAHEPAVALGGFVLMLNNITRDHDRREAQARTLADLVQGQREGLEQVHQAVQRLDADFSDSPARARWQADMHQLLQQMQARLPASAAHGDTPDPSSAGTMSESSLDGDDGPAELPETPSPAGRAGSATPRPWALTPQDSRPEYYDFDLFSASESRTALDDRLLTELDYTVFDTETTGLNPTEGDQIIQLGAVRVVRGRVLRQECFDQLVDPGRPIPAAGLPIHGISDAMVRGQPAVAAVLPAFHAFVGDTVLVAHNAAFDMRFLQLQEARTQLRFDQPVLDTLLLSAAVHPQQDSHRLDAIAERLGVPVVGRHQALGDALVTAEVLVRLLPLLAAQGICTLGQARAAAQQTWYARLKY